MTSHCLTYVSYGSSKFSLSTVFIDFLYMKRFAVTLRPIQWEREVPEHVEENSFISHLRKRAVASAYSCVCAAPQWRWRRFSWILWGRNVRRSVPWILQRRWPCLLRWWQELCRTRLSRQL